MSTSKLIYIAGPYAGATSGVVWTNVERAVRLGRAFARLGHTPIVPHTMGCEGVYGFDVMDDGGASTTRETALRCGVEMARFVARAGGVFAGITKPDGTLSAGTEAERAAFVDEAAEVPDARVFIQSWDDWQRWPWAASQSRREHETYHGNTLFLQETDMNMLYGSPPTDIGLRMGEALAEALAKANPRMAPGVELAEADTAPAPAPASALARRLRERGVKAFEDGDDELAALLREAWLALADTP